MNRSLRILLEGLIDYAGLFPPAELGMAEAVKNYAAYQRGAHSWMLGRFIVPAARLDEFAQAATEHWPQPNEAWKLSVLSNQLETNVARINSFNRQHSANAVIDAVEIKAATVADIEAARHVLPPTLTCYIEIPIAYDPTALINAIADAGARAKVRTGGVTADGFPSSRDLARFMTICAAEDVGFKATAGLHHPLRAVNRLTYAPDSDTATMHGFLNVFIAAALAQNGVEMERLVEVLEERLPTAFQFAEGSIVWRDEMIVRGQLRNTRSLFAFSFGSCSFTEPIEDLQKLGLL